MEAIREHGLTLASAGRLLVRVVWTKKKRRPTLGELTQLIFQIGVGSLPMILIATGFAGLVVTTEIAWHMNRALNTLSMIPGFTGQFVLRELGVAIPALLLVSKAGAAMTAEVGSMVVTEQVDALKLLRIDPVEFIVYPRFIATVIANVCLTFFAMAFTLACAILMAALKYHFSLLEYLNATRAFVTQADLLAALVKAILFGAAIPILSCAYGFRCKGGAQGVGQATTHAVVAGTLAVILLDFTLTFVFTA